MPAQLKEIKEEEIGGDYEQSHQKDGHSQVQKLVLPPSKLNQIQNKLTEQRTTFDTNSNRKVNTDSQQRTNFNTSMQNIPRGLINTAFSLNSVGSREETQKPSLPISPQLVLKHYINELTDYEKGEVLDFDMVYYLGVNRNEKVDEKRDKIKQTEIKEASKDKEGSSNSDDKGNSAQKEKEGVFNQNHGYDDEKGDYKIIVGDHIGYRYQIVEFLGKGSFGTAIRCIDHKEKKQVAVKIVKNKKKYYYQASVELKIL